jgi:transcriptional regulator with XRE-family HTH domain
VLPIRTREQIIQLIIDALRQERQRQGRSQNELARSAGLSQPMVLRVEKYERLPTIDTLLRLAEALGVDLGKIISEASKGGGRKGH